MTITPYFTKDSITSSHDLYKYSEKILVRKTPFEEGECTLSLSATYWAAPNPRDDPSCSTLYAEGSDCLAF